MKYFDLEELWFVSGRGNSRTFFPIHDFANHLDSDLVENLPAVHALTRCDTTSKFGTKNRAVREEDNCYQLLYAFGRDVYRCYTLKFLLKCITKHDVDTCDELRFIVYDEKYLKLDNERFPRPSDNIRQHILRSYLQCYIGYTLLFWETLSWTHSNMVIY